MKRALGITSLTLALAASAAAAGYLYLTQVPRLAYPLQRLDGWALSDGGSYVLEVVDAEGRIVLLGIQATALDVPVERYPAFIGRPLFGLPLTVTAGLGTAPSNGRSMHSPTKSPAAGWRKRAGTRPGPPSASANSPTPSRGPCMSSWPRAAGEGGSEAGGSGEGRARRPIAWAPGGEGERRR